MLRGYAPRYSADKSSNGIISFDFDVHRRQSEMHVSNLIISCYKCHAVSGLEIRVVLWPQSTRTSGGPPDCATWWSGGLLETFNH